jgi:deazaflavin-dependent oxidoreductase (nitroreductase family)
MRLPEPLFVFINPVVRTLLRSPLHPLLSGSVLLITFTGRRTGRHYTTPVRYVRSGESIRCFSSPETLWWRNLRGGAQVRLRIAGMERDYSASAIQGDPVRILAALREYLALFPQDAAYHSIARNRDGSLSPADLERAAHEAVVVEARPL